MVKVKLGNRKWVNIIKVKVTKEGHGSRYKQRERTLIRAQSQIKSASFGIRTLD